MSRRVALVMLDGDVAAGPVGGATGDWSLGPRVCCAAHGTAICRGIEEVVDQVDFVLLWHQALGPPSEQRVAAVAELPGDVWHAGLMLGQGGRPKLMDTVHPGWMLLQDPDPGIVATSWRLTLRACLVRSSVWRQLGGPSGAFETLDGAALELGLRWLWAGALLRHVPGLLDAAESKLPLHENDDAQEPLPTVDQLRIIQCHSRRFWSAWATVRGLLTRRVGVRAVADWWRLHDESGPDGSLTYATADDSERVGDATEGPKPRISVLIPTLDRYSYLTVVIDQLAHQTLPPLEIIVIDQTAKARRKRQMVEGLVDPSGPRLIYLERDVPGQSSARNAGLERASGDYVMFLDDDVDIESDLLERHADNLRKLGADASCGTTLEVGAGDLPRDFQRRRASDVFPTCNALLKRQALVGSGLFDLAFDHGARADADLGTRLYLSGHLMVLDPGCSLVHFKAPSGGLREHGARVVTFADSRKRLLARHLPSPTEIYLSLRYTSPAQTREMLMLRALGTLRARGSKMQQLIKLFLGLVRLPGSLWSIAANHRHAEEMLATYPIIPAYEVSEPPPGGGS